MRKFITGGVAASTSLALGLLGAASASAAEDSVKVTAQGGVESVDVLIDNRTGGAIECLVGGTDGVEDGKFFAVPGEVLYPIGSTPIHFDDVSPGTYQPIISCTSNTLGEAWLTKAAFINGPPENPEPGLWVLPSVPLTVRAAPVDPGNCFGSICF
ncbi:hypothetical protein [Williamsia sp. DF01-3]|uniref:hypothetical protein n=1 Tax=Williamsia sp. DF01-3 TaxID=2934157 RepID=UPI001FF45E43|nr:hypothetical protein [Williamsia sp. DF01-3]MCK0515686.1 hypothetical protein [Williamsia sp. DF01-3]